jgi:hypothetical protein
LRVSSPEDIEGIAFTSSIPVLDPNDGAAALPWIPDQILTAPAVHTGEAELSGIVRQRARALETAPLRRLAGEISQSGLIASYRNFRGTIHYHFDCTFAAIRGAAAQERSPA